MSKLSQKEIENVVKLDAFSRYKYFVKRVAECEVLYFLADRDGNFALAIIGETQLFSIWSDREYVEFNKTTDWVSAPVETELKQFISEIIPEIKSAGYLLNVFSLNNKSGFIVNTEEFIRDLNEELEKYE